MKVGGLASALLLTTATLLSTTLPSAAQEAPADSAWAATVGLITIPGHELYSGRVNVRTAGINTGGRYIESVDLGLGLQAQAFLTSDALGRISLSAYGTRAGSTGFYSGIAGEETLTRDLVTVGLDMGWEPALWRGSRSVLRVPFGPSVVWQSLDLSSGHRDAYANPEDLGDPPEVTWSDRTWLSMGGYGGLGLTLRMTDHLGVALDATGRFLFSDKGAWAGQEEEDIRRSTGRAVKLLYEQPILFLWTVRAGLQWRP